MLELSTPATATGAGAVMTLTRVKRAAEFYSACTVCCALLLLGSSMVISGACMDICLLCARCNWLGRFSSGCLFSWRWQGLALTCLSSCSCGYSYGFGILCLLRFRINALIGLVDKASAWVLLQLLVA